MSLDFSGFDTIVVGWAALAVPAFIYRLARMRRKQQGRYLIPRGGAFRFLSTPNQTGEMVEWMGFALMA